MDEMGRRTVTALLLVMVGCSSRAGSQVVLGVHVGRSSQSNALTLPGPSPTAADLQGGADFTATGVARRAPEALNSPWDAGGLLPYPLAYAGAAVVEGNVYLVGGVSDGGVVGDVNVFALGGNSANNFPGSISPRANLGLVAAGGNLYAVGGIDPSGNILTDVEVGTVAFGTVEAWQPTTQLSFGRENGALAYGQGTLYLVGGDNPFGSGSGVFGDIQSAPLLVDGGVGAWSSVANLPVGPLTGAGAVVSRGNLYLVGGSDGSNSSTDVEMAAINPDGSLGAWQVLNPLNVARANLALVEADGYLVAIGGSAAGTEVEEAVIFDNGMLGNWTPRYSLPMGRQGASAVSSSGTVTVLGGSTPISNVLLSDIQTTATATDRTVVMSPWVDGGFLDQHEASVPSVLYNGRTYFVASNASSFQPENSIGVTTLAPSGAPSLHVATAASAAGPSGGVYRPAAAAYDGYLYVVGGCTPPDCGNPVLTSVYAGPIAVDGTIGALSATSSFPSNVSMQGPVAVAKNGKMYVFPGFSGNPSLTGYVSDIIGGGQLSSTWTSFTILSAFTQPYMAATLYRNEAYYGMVEDNSNGDEGGFFQALVGATGVGPWVEGPSAFQYTGRSINYGLTAFGYEDRLYVFNPTNSPTGSYVLEDTLGSDGGLGPSWSLGSVMLDKVAAGSLVLYNGKAVAQGGGQNGSNSDEATEYSDLNGSGALGGWTLLGSLPGAPRTGAAAVASGGVLYVIGGELQAGTVASAQSSVFAGIPGAGGAVAFTKLTNAALPVAAVNASAAASDGFIFAAGGMDPAGVVQSSVTAWAIVDGGLSAPVPATSLPSPRESFGLAAWNHNLYAVAGDDGGTNLYDVVAQSARRQSPHSVRPASAWRPIRRRD